MHSALAQARPPAGAAIRHAPVPASGSRRANGRASHEVAAGSDRAWAGSYRRMDGISVLFTPLLNLATGVITGLEVLPTPAHPGMRDVIAAVGSSEHCVVLDAGVAAGGIDRAHEFGTRLPLRVNVLADTVADDTGVLDVILDALGAAGRRPPDLTVELGPAVGDPDPAAVLAGARRLRAHGVRLCVDEVGLDHHPLALIAMLAPDQVKLHPEVVAGLETDPGAVAVAEATARLCRRIGAELLADGITTAGELEAVRARGIWHGQGPLVAGPARRPAGPAAVTLPARDPHTGTAPWRAPVPGADRWAPGTIGGFAQPAVTLPESSTGGQVRDAFRDDPVLSTIVLTDAEDRAVGTLDRNRFMLAVSGRYGFALHDQRPARGLADPPRVLPAHVGPRQALSLTREGPPDRLYDDVVITDRQGRCAGLVRVGDLLRGSAELGYQHALERHPLTGFPAGRHLAVALEQRVDAGRGLGAAVLVPDLGPATDTGGYDAAADAVTALSHRLTDGLAGIPTCWIAHAPGDDIVVLVDPAHLQAVAAALRAAGATEDAPDLPVAVAWLCCEPGRPVDAADLARQLTRLGRLGPGPGGDRDAPGAVTPLPLPAQPQRSGGL